MTTTSTEVNTRPYFVFWSAEENHLLQKNGSMWMCLANYPSTSVDCMLYTPKPAYERLIQKSASEKFFLIDFTKTIERYVVFKEGELNQDYSWSTLQQCKDYIACFFLYPENYSDADISFIVVDLSKMYFDFSVHHPDVVCHTRIDSGNYESMETL
jgi:hypothetical protein